MARFHYGASPTGGGGQVVGNEMLVLSGARKSQEIADSLRRVIDSSQRHADLFVSKLAELVAGIANQTDLLNRQLMAMTAGIANQTELINNRLSEVTAAVAGQAEIVSRMSSELAARLAHHSRGLDELRNGTLGQLGELSRAIDDLIHRSVVLERKLDDAKRAPTDVVIGSRGISSAAFQAAVRHMPLELAPQTFNVTHPSFTPDLARNFPGQIVNPDFPCENPAFAALAGLRSGAWVPDEAWAPLLADMLIEASRASNACQLFERRTFAENYFAELSERHRALYFPGWANFDAASFLYWLVLQTKPRRIVQCGGGNGLSTAFLLLALAKNGPDGRLILIDKPPVFDAAVLGWTTEGGIYGPVVPAGMATAWMVPDGLRDRLDIVDGEVGQLLPVVVASIDSIDFLHYAAEPVYERMMVSFEQVKRRLSPGGVVAADDIGWNASLWDFADRFEVPALNFKGAVGAAFF